MRWAYCTPIKTIVRWPRRPRCLASYYPKEHTSSAHPPRDQTTLNYIVHGEAPNTVMMSAGTTWNISIIIERLQLSLNVARYVPILQGIIPRASVPFSGTTFDVPSVPIACLSWIEMPRSHKRHPSFWERPMPPRSRCSQQRAKPEPQLQHSRFGVIGANSRAHDAAMRKVGVKSTRAESQSQRRRWSTPSFRKSELFPVLLTL